MVLYVKYSLDVTTEPRYVGMEEYKRMFYLSEVYSYYKLFPFIIHLVTINVSEK